MMMEHLIVMVSRVALRGWLLLALVVPVPGMAETLPPPEGAVILTVTGNITRTTDGNTALFDIAGLEAIGTTTLVTRTPWDEEPVEFEGVLGRRLFDYLGGEASTVEATALNDYRTIIPMSDFYDHDVIFALKRNGTYMPIRGKGPIFVVYPFDDDPDLWSQIYLTRSIWQLNWIKLD